MLDSIKEPQLDISTYGEARPLRSFARRVGKSLSKLQHSLLEHHLPSFKFNSADFSKNFVELSKQFNEICLEIGFGMGEHLHNLALNYPTKFFIGSEPYLNGVANLTKYMLESKLNNLAIWPDDIDLIVSSLPDSSIASIYILFPDPWPKNSQLKRRFMNNTRLGILKNKLKLSGKIYFASDISNYINYLDKLIAQIDGLVKINKDIHQPHQKYSVTKYHLKAVAEGRLPLFVEYSKKF